MFFKFKFSTYINLLHFMVQLYKEKAGNFMKSVGIICEYNPFHNGHIYHIKKVKELYPEHIIVLIMSGNFTQRGEISLINKWDKTKIALDFVDLVIELPFCFSTQSADIFAYGSTSILKKLNVNALVFGAESNFETLEKIARIQKDKKYNDLVKKYLNEGLNYPTCLSKAAYDLTGININKPNDLLGISYIKNLLDSNIEIKTIKRTNDFYNSDLSNNIISASCIRNLLKENKKINKYVPKQTLKQICAPSFNDDYFNYLKYKIICEINNLKIYQTVDEGIENRIKKYIYKCNSYEQLIEKLKTKRYTYNKIKRMLIHILCGFTKKDAEKFKEIQYIRVLGFNKKGREYLNKIKKDIQLPIVTNYYKNEMFDFEIKTDMIYNINKKNKENEYARKPIC